ncbi:MAG: YkgJ family cysteine cluster protein [Chromatiales bacterium]|nr:YkgJ family cysteine cluster protein [Chromatiales bacterium]
MSDIDISQSPFPASPVVPELFDGSKVISFRCHKDIKCFNACCSNIDISLTPYDIIRLKNRLGMNSDEFLLNYSFPYEMEREGMAGVKFKPVENGTACQFMVDEGCSVYEDRPTACRYYPVGLVSQRKQDEYVDRTAFAVVKEPHCMGHLEDRKLTIDEYRQEQGLEEYDKYGHGWRQLILKKKSTGPAVGKPSKRSLQLFFMACYDIDRFRLFINSDGFKSSFDVSEEEYATFEKDDVALLEFSYRFLKQVLFAEETIAMRDGALDARIGRTDKSLEELQAERERKGGDAPDIEPVDIA